MIMKINSEILWTCSHQTLNRIKIFLLQKYNLCETKLEIRFKLNELIEMC